MTFEYKGAHPRTGTSWYRLFWGAPRAEVFGEEETPPVAEMRAAVAEEQEREMTTGEKRFS